MLKPGADGARRVAARRRLVADAGLRARPHRHVPQPRGARGAGHRRAGRGGGGAQGRDRREADAACATTETGAVGDQRGVRHRDALRRARTSRTRPTCSIGYNARLPRLVGRRHRRRRRARCSRTTPRRGAATTASIRGSCRACSSATGRSTTSDPALVDIAPTVLRLFGLEPPRTWTARPLGGTAHEPSRRASCCSRRRRRRSCCSAAPRCGSRHARPGRRVDRARLRRAGLRAHAAS